MMNDYYQKPVSKQKKKKKERGSVGAIEQGWSGLRRVYMKKKDFMRPVYKCAYVDLCCVVLC